MQIKVLFSTKSSKNLHMSFRSSTFGLRLLRIPPKVRSHLRANANLFNAKIRLYKYRRYFFAKNLAHSKNL